MYVNRGCKFRRQKCDQERSLEYSKKYKDITTEIQRMWNVEKKSDTGHNTGIWNHLKITDKISEQPTGKARNQETTGNSHIWRCIHSLESTNVNVRNIQHGK
jgi:hypothetical protein